MNSYEDISISIDFEQISVQSIEPKASNGKGRVVFKVLELLRVPETNKPGNYHVKSEDLKIDMKGRHGKFRFYENRHSVLRNPEICIRPRCSPCRIRRT